MHICILYTVLLKIYFQAGVTIAALEKNNTSATVTFGARLNRPYVLQSTLDPASSNSWITVSDVFTGNDYLAPLVDTNAITPHKFYRIKDVGL